MFTNKKRRRIKPFARPTSFDFNAVFDLRHMQQQKYGSTKPADELLFPQTCNTDEGYQVMEGEVLMQMNGGAQVRRYGDHQMHCFGFANGLKMNTEAPECERHQALAQLKYAGVAVTGFKPEVDIFEQGFVVTVAGLNTIFNNGDSDVHPGDLICASVPTPGTGRRGTAATRGARAAGRGQNRANAQGGIPHSKIGFTVTPYRTLIQELEDETRLRIRGELSPIVKDAIQELASRFIMGTAMSYAKPGYPLDVVLHRCNIISVRRADEGEFKSGGDDEEFDEYGFDDNESALGGYGDSEYSDLQPKAPNATLGLVPQAPTAKVTKVKKAKSSKKNNK